MLRYDSYVTPPANLLKDNTDYFILKTLKIVYKCV